jgi:hypothetical protein
MPTPENDPTALVGRALALWGAATGQITTEPEPDDPTPDHLQMLGQYLAEALYETGITGTGLTGDDLGARRRTAMAQGATAEWFTKARAHDQAGPEALAVLAWLVEMVHAALDGVRAAGCDVDDAHEYAVRLQDCVAAAAGVSGVVAAAQQIAADSASREG